MKWSRQSASNNRRNARSMLVWAVPLLLFGAVAAYGIALWTGVHAESRVKVPRATLDTADGLYVIGEPPGRVEVLFFSFAG